MKLVPTADADGPAIAAMAQASVSPRASRGAALPRWTTRLVRSLTGAIALLVLAAMWEAAPRVGLVDAVFLPPLSRVLQAWWSLLLSGDLYANIEASVLLALTGLALSIVFGVAAGLLIGWYRPAARMLNPIIELCRNTAPLALLPVFILTLGIGQASKIAIVLYACIWPIILNTIMGVQGVDPLLIKLSRSMGFGPLQTFRKFVLPAAVPSLFTGIRLAGAASMLVLIAAEMVGANKGLGFYITYAQSNFQIPNMYAGILTIALVGLAFNQALLVLERHFSAWRR
jgi:NitT/TauT family transport system permease protein